jgi:hypothetical protein
MSRFSRYERIEHLRGLDNIVVQVCGGALMDSATLAQLQTDLGAGETYC